MSNNSRYLQLPFAQTGHPKLARPYARAASLSMLLGMVLLSTAHAQQVYRIVGPDGRVTFSDQPPPADAPLRATAVGSAGVSSASAVASLPMALRQPVTRFPVTLYTGEGCSPCDTGRNLLNSRGIPYTEKTVNTADDAAAFKRLTNETALPVITIGAQKIQGFSDLEWSQYLDAAGFPKSSVLPAGYRRAAPSPMVASQPLPAAARPAANAAPNAAATGGRRSPAGDSAEVPIEPAVENPAGIRF